MSSIMMPPLSFGFPPEPIARLTVEQYHTMIDAGKLTDDDAIELLEGWLVPKMPKNPPHRVSTRLTHSALDRLLPEWYVESQEPMTTSDSEPEPDIYVARGKVRDYSKRHPGPEDMRLIVEVADTTLARDRGIKKRLYARAAIPVYWIFNLPERCVEVYTDPSGATETPDYGHRQVYGENDRVPVVLDGHEVGQLEVQAILP